jgi:gas vesicle protein
VYRLLTGVFILSLIPKPSISPDARLTVLEERLQAFDELSRQMLSKLEQAVDKISESNQNISRILTRHEERIDRSAEANSATLKIIERTESDLKDKIQTLETSIEDLKKTRWIWFGVVIAATFFINQFNLSQKLFHTEPNNALYTYERVLP